MFSIVVPIILLESSFHAYSIKNIKTQRRKGAKIEKTVYSAKIKSEHLIAEFYQSSGLPLFAPLRLCVFLK
jgi:hypothetical protein